MKTGTHTPMPHHPSIVPPSQRCNYLHQYTYVCIYIYKFTHKQNCIPHSSPCCTSLPSSWTPLGILLISESVFCNFILPSIKRSHRSEQKQNRYMYTHTIQALKLCKPLTESHLEVMYLFALCQFPPPPPPPPPKKKKKRENQQPQNNKT